MSRRHHLAWVAVAMDAVLGSLFVDWPRLSREEKRGYYVVLQVNYQ